MMLIDSHVPVIYDGKSGYRSYPVLPNVQRKLSSAQAIPLIGILGAVAKTAVSIYQVVGNLFQAFKMSLSDDYTTRDYHSSMALTYCAMGGFSLGWALINIPTAGLAAFFAKHVFNKEPHL